MESRLTLIRELWSRQSKSGRKEKIWLYKCTCGNEKEIAISNAKGTTFSCGCLKKEGNKTTHWMTNTRIYQIYMGMKKRCENKLCEAYKYYGGKWIKICERWNTFSNFLEDNKEKYADNLTIDRIDSNWGYEPSNCQWITWWENSRKARKGYTIFEDGTKICKRGHIGNYFLQGINKNPVCRICKKRYDITYRTKLSLNALKNSLLITL